MSTSLDTATVTSIHVDNHRVLQGLLEASGDPGLVVSHGNCSWDDVLDSMESARTEHSTKSDKNKLRAVPRNRAIVTTLHSLCEMIPEQDGLSVLRGGLKLVFGV